MSKITPWDYGIFLLPILFVIAAFLGISSDWMHNAIDSWRLQECTILFVSLSYANVRFRDKAIQLNTIGTFLIVCLLSYLSFLIYTAEYSLLALLDGCFILALMGYGYFFYHILLHLPVKKVDFAVAIAALSPAYCILWLIIGYYLYFTSGVPLVWHGLFTNIRYYDDALLPLIFLLWYQPSFLKSYPKLVLLVSAGFLLTLWLDAARANWLGICIGLLSILVFYPKGYQKISLPLTSIVASLVFYKLIQLFDVSAAQYTVLRGEDGTRWRMWLGAWHQWFDNPLKGIGGANFVFAEQINPLRIGHPHNLIVQLIIEWGMVGLLIALIMGYGLYWLFKQRSYISPILYAGTVALFINTLLSGAHVYPISQIAMLIYFCFVISKIKINLSNEPTSSLKFTKINTMNINKISIFRWGLISTLIIISIISSNFFQYGNQQGLKNNNPSLGPRFWSNAQLVTME